MQNLFLSGVVGSSSEAIQLHAGAVRRVEYHENVVAKQKKAKAAYF